MRIGIKEPKITVMDENRQRSKCNFLYVTKPTYGTQSGHRFRLLIQWTTDSGNSYNLVESAHNEARL